MNIFSKLENKKCSSTLCPLNGKYSSVAIGVGSETAKIMFIGEAPGAQDMTEGAPYRGESGALFRSLLRQVGIPEKDCFFTNVIFCRGNEDKTPKGAVKACAGYLDDEIARVSPKIIVPLGNIALERIQGIKSIVRNRGKGFSSSKYGAKVIPTINPAAIYRNEHYKEMILADLQRVKRDLALLEGDQKQEETDYAIIKTLDEAKSLFKILLSAEEFTFDIETTDLSFLKDKILGISFCWKEKTARYLPLLKYKAEEQWNNEEKDQIIAGLKEALSSPARKIAHNGKFDCKFLRKAGILVTNFCFDTMLAHHLLDENRPHGLKDLARTYTTLGGYEEELDQYLPTKRTSYSEIPLEILGKYACIDADCTLRLKEIFANDLVKEKVEQVFNLIVMPMNDLLTDIEYIGVKVDKEYLLSLEEQYRKEIERLSIAFKATAGENVNMSSPKQLRELFFDKLKLRPTRKTPSQQYSTDQKALAELATQHEIPKLILEFRKVEKLYNTFIQGLLAATDEEFRVHTEYSINGTVTGRLSSTNPNLQNIPNTAEMRKVFIPSTGWHFVIADFSQMELRVMCEYSRDKNLLEAFEKGEDVHTATASRALKIPFESVTEKQRSLAKGIVFGLIYGRSARSIAEELKVSAEEAESFVRRFFGAYSGVHSWMEGQKRLAKEKGFVRNLFGRKRRLPEITSRDFEKVASAERQSMNSVVQGGASDITCLAALRITEELKKRVLKARLVLTIHDELVFECPAEELEQIKDLVTLKMKNPFKKEGFFKTPLEISMKTAECWI